MSKPQFGDLLREGRFRKGLSLRQVAGQSGIEHSRLARIEQGTRPAPNLTDIRTLARILSLDLHELLVSAGTSREVVEEILWAERVRMAEAFSDLEAYRPEAPALRAKNTFRVSVVERDGAVCRARLGETDVVVLSFTSADCLSITIPPEAVLVSRAPLDAQTIGVENRIPLEILKVRHVGQITNLVLEGDGFELNSLLVHRAIEAMGLEVGDRVEALIPAAAIHTAPWTPEDER